MGGWIYLERFIAMVKVAMVGDSREEQERIAFSNSEAVLQHVFQSGAALRRAAKAGSVHLAHALEGHFEELKQKTFGGASTDKLTNKNARPGAVSDCGEMSDRQVVEAIMRGMVDYLESHWV